MDVCRRFGLRLFRCARKRPLGAAALLFAALLAAPRAIPAQTPAGPAAPGSPPPAGLLRLPLPSPPARAFHPPSVGRAEDARLFAEAARAAWRYVEREYQPATGLVNSVAGYPYGTLWDITSGLAALYCANRLSLLDDAEYDRRMRRALLTLQTARLFDGAVFNKNYSTRTGDMAGRDASDAAGARRGYGWSAIDIGRLLVWLRILSVHDPEYAPLVERIVARLDLSRLVGSDGYLRGETVNPSGRRTRYVEGRIPYEQYAAAGYGLWGRPAERAARLHENSLPISVDGIPLYADRRGLDHLTSEPFVLMGLELGWSPEMERFAADLLRAQASRYHRTGEVTIVSEDAIPLAPHYFFYYTVNYHGTQFAVTTQTGTVLRSPRWVSAKGALAWNALLPSTYTRLAAATVAPAASERGWGSGVYERTREPTGGENVNTAAVILEAALYFERGKALVE